MNTIRKANPNDAQAIFDLKSRAILAKCSAHYTEEQLSLWAHGSVSERFIDDVVDTFYVSEIDGQVIGSGKLNTQTDVVDAIFVEPDYSGRGAAKKMLQFLEHLAKEQDLRLLTLNAAPFYRACGFVGDEVSTYHSPKGIRLDCVPMEKPL
ncbi:GNAT family N-acetyltransferase [Salinivibrio sp. ES.052]|uniref:GNAT family N-acetyltransferase n=1 Tax=Salinivibrio sp. ES.052 TaxID=1882823 RepID=UPI00092917F0|nr:GNAT family N-acetyltransferase [Salinivibrio sp. ES.052]SIN82906.1 Acetyltransferase, GNAT family [Salinivibrio sp. ES.052]